MYLENWLFWIKITGLKIRKIYIYIWKYKCITYLFLSSAGSFLWKTEFISSIVPFVKPDSTSLQLDLTCFNQYLLPYLFFCNSMLWHASIPGSLSPLFSRLSAITRPKSSFTFVCKITIQFTLNSSLILHFFQYEKEICFSHFEFNNNLFIRDEGEVLEFLREMGEQLFTLRDRHVDENTSAERKRHYSENRWLPV